MSYMVRGIVGVWATLAAAASFALLFGSAFLAERSQLVYSGPLRGGSERKACTFHRKQLSIRLSKSFVSQGGTRRPEDFAAPDGTVVWTLGNHSWLDFVLNWVASAERAGVREYFVGSLDDQLLDELMSRGIPAVKVGGSLGGEELEWGSTPFRERGKLKIRFIRSMVEAGLQPFFMDLDAVPLGDPLPLLRLLPEADILISTDHLQPGELVRGLEICPVPGIQEGYMGFMNVGMHLVRRGAVPVLKAWEQAMGESDRQEQQVFNDVMMVGIHSAATQLHWSPYCRAANDSVTVGLLSTTIFPNGHLYFYQGLADWEHAPLSALAAHANYIISKDAKRHHMRERGLWLVDGVERFEPPGGFLSVDLQAAIVPLEMAPLSGGHASDYADSPVQEQQLDNLGLLKHQLSQVLAAMRLSLALGRELILPQLWCGPDSQFYHHSDFTLAGASHTRLMRCPLGTVVDIPAWVKKARAGLLPVFHEHALLAHPLMRSKSWLAVSPAGVQQPLLQALNHNQQPPPRAGSGQCHDSPAGCELSLPAHQTLQELTAALQAARDVDILEINNIAALLKEADEGDEAGFDSALEGLVHPAFA